MKTKNKDQIIGQTLNYLYSIIITTGSFHVKVFAVDLEIKNPHPAKMKWWLKITTVGSGLRPEPRQSINATIGCQTSRQVVRNDGSCNFQL